MSNQRRNGTRSGRLGCTCGQNPVLNTTFRGVAPNLNPHRTDQTFSMRRAQHGQSRGGTIAPRGGLKALNAPDVGKCLLKKERLGEPGSIAILGASWFREPHERATRAAASPAAGPVLDLPCLGGHGSMMLASTGRASGTEASGRDRVNAVKPFGQLGNHECGEAGRTRSADNHRGTVLLG